MEDIYRDVVGVTTFFNSNLGHYIKKNVMCKGGYIVSHLFWIREIKHV